MATEQRTLFSSDELIPPPGASALDVNDPTVLRLRRATVNLSLLRRSPSLELNLFADTRFVADIDRVESVSTIGSAWVGHVAWIENSQVILAVADGVFTAAINVPPRLFSVTPRGDGPYVIAEVARDAIPADAVGPALPILEADARRLPAADSGGDLDLLLYYTTAARIAAGGTGATNALVTASIAQVNAVFANSGVATRLRLRAAIEVGYAESGSASRDLNALRANADVAAMRNQFQADMVAMLVSRDPQASGYAFASVSRGVPRPELAFSTVVLYDFIPYIFALAHEVGHILGCLHEPGNNSSFGGDSGGAFAYSLGYTDFGRGFHDVMSYGLGCPNCALVDQFSNTTRTYQGFPVGTPGQDCARTINETRVIVANYRSSSIGPPRNVSASVAGSSVVLSWQPPLSGVATSYIIEAGSATGRADIASFDTGAAGLSFAASGVAAGLYYLRLRATDGVTVSDASNEVVVSIDAECLTAPPPPSGLRASVVGSTVTLAWSPSATARSYVVEAGLQPGASDIAALDLGTPATELTVPGVGPGTFFIRMRAKNACGVSQPSSEVVATVR